MTISIIGASGFLGTRVANALARRGHRLLLADRVAPSAPPPEVASGAHELVVGELSETLPRVITNDTTAVISLAAVVSSGAEADFDLGYDVNLLGLRAQLERCRALATTPKFAPRRAVALAPWTTVTLRSWRRRSLILT